MYQVKLKSASPLSGEGLPDVVYAGGVGRIALQAAPIRDARPGAEVLGQTSMPKTALIKTDSKVRG